MTSLVEFVLEPLAYDFMQRALLVAMLVGAMCAVLSCYLVLKGWALMGDAVSHAVLPGIVLAYVLGLPLVAGAFAAGLFSAVATGFLRDNSRVKEDTVMGIVFSGMFGLGLVLFTKVDTEQHLTHILFGNMLGVTLRDVIETGAVSALVLAVVAAKGRDLLLYCFDQAYARAIGLPIGVLHYGLLVLLALAIVASLKAVGIILVVAMLIAPGATAYLATARFSRMLPLAVLVSVLSSALGTVLSYHLDASTGPIIVLVQAAVFLSVLIVTSLRGRWRGAGLSTTTDALASETCGSAQTG